MGDVMLCGVLRMPFDHGGDMHLMQLQSRCHEAANELEKRADEIEHLRAEVERLTREKNAADLEYSIDYHAHNLLRLQYGQLDSHSTQLSEQLREARAENDKLRSQLESLDKLCSTLDDYASEMAFKAHDAFEKTAFLCAGVERQISQPCDHCGDGKRTGLPGNACENCMNTGSKHPELATIYSDFRRASLASRLDEEAGKP